jgi:hypothetical protein
MHDKSNRNKPPPPERQNRDDPVRSLLKEQKPAPVDVARFGRKAGEIIAKAALAPHKGVARK